jgi:hypothetical protein
MDQSNLQSFPVPQNSHLCESMMSQSEFDSMLYDHLKDRLHLDQNFSVFKSFILPKIKNISVKAVLSSIDRLEKVGKGFEWLGLDLIVIENSFAYENHQDLFEVMLLEVNVSPDISPSTPVTARLVEDAVDDLLNLIIHENGVDPINSRIRVPNDIARSRAGSTLNDASNYDEHGSNTHVNCDSIPTLKTILHSQSRSALPHVFNSDKEGVYLKWELWHTQNQLPRSDINELSATKTMNTETDITNTAIDYGPRDDIVAHKVNEFFLFGCCSEGDNLQNISGKDGSESIDNIVTEKVIHCSPEISDDEI